MVHFFAAGSHLLQKKKKTKTGDALISHPHAKKNPLQFYKLVLSIQVMT